jgi:hypothetical protein
MLETVFYLGWESPAVLTVAGFVLLVTAAMLVWLTGRMRALWKLNLSR